MDTSLNKTTSVGIANDYELLLLMSWKDEDEDEAKIAFREFYQKHCAFLTKVCNRVCLSNLPRYGQELARDVLFNTFKKVYEKAGVIVQKLDEYKAKGSQNLNEKLLAYMCVVAQNELNNLMKAEKAHHLQLQYHDPDDFVLQLDRADELEEQEDELEHISEFAEKLHGALATLPERERDVLLTYMRYSDSGKHLPDEEIEALCSRYGVIPNYLRLIKKRAMDKVVALTTKDNKLT
jgi:DNA-directed RNA polymerase specialized sigma24 family protein